MIDLRDANKFNIVFLNQGQIFVKKLLSRFNFHLSKAGKYLYFEGETDFFKSKHSFSLNNKHDGRGQTFRKS